MRRRPRLGPRGPAPHAAGKKKPTKERHYIERSHDLSRHYEGGRFLFPATIDTAAGSERCGHVVMVDVMSRNDAVSDMGWLAIQRGKGSSGLQPGGRIKFRATVEVGRLWLPCIVAVNGEKER